MDCIFDAEALFAFLTIHETGGFSSAAALLGRSQPAISRRIALLEQELDVPLFERSSSGVVLSQAGQVLLPHAQRVLSAIEDCTSAIAALRSGTGGPLTVAIVGTLAGANLTPILKRFSTSHPDVDLALCTGTSAEVSELVRDGSATIGLRYHRDISQSLNCTEIAAESMQIVCPTDHALAGKTLRSLRPLAEERWLAFPGAHTIPESSPHNLFAQFQLLGICDGCQWTVSQRRSAWSKPATVWPYCRTARSLTNSPPGACQSFRLPNSIWLIQSTS